MSRGPLYEGFVPGRHTIDAYGNGGFRFAEMSHRGSILALPSGIKAWDISTASATKPEDFAPIFTEAAEIDFVLFGTGADIAFVPEVVRAAFREAGIGLDPMQTGAAARTYNILVAEGRRVAAALIAVA